MGDAREDDPSAVAIIFDGSPNYWEDDATLAGAIGAVLLFANAFRLLNAGNRLLLVGEHPKAAKCLLPGPAAASPWRRWSQILRKTLVGSAGQMIMAEVAGGSLVGGALALALCRLAAARRAAPRLQLRVLVLHASPDVPGQHLPAMNCAFAAKKLGVIVDAIVLAPSDSPLLQTAADVTGGLYLKPDAAARAGLAQYLLSACLPDQHARQIVRPPAQGKLETRALCYLTKQPVEIGHACSVCLTVFADPTALGSPPTCPVCGERFVLKPVPKPPPKKKQRPPPPPPQQVRTPRRAARPRRPAFTPPAAAASLPQTCALPPARSPPARVAAHPPLSHSLRRINPTAEARAGGGEGGGRGGARRGGGERQNEAARAEAARRRKTRRRRRRRRRPRTAEARAAGRGGRRRRRARLRRRRQRRRARGGGEGRRKKAARRRAAKAAGDEARAPRPAAAEGARKARARAAAAKAAGATRAACGGEGGGSEAARAWAAQAAKTRRRARCGRPAEAAEARAAG